MKRFKLILFLMCFMIANFAFSNFDTTQCKELLLLSSKLQRTKPDSSIYFAQKAVAFANHIHDTSYIIKSYLQLSSSYYWGLSDHNKCKKTLDTLELNYFNKLSRNQKCVFYSRMGDAVYYREELVKSIEYYYKALDFVDKDSVMLARLYHNLGYVYADFNRFDKAIEFGLKSLRIATISKGDSIHKLEGLFYIYRKAKNYEKALYYLARSDKNDTAVYRTTFNDYLRADLFRIKKEYDKALTYGVRGFLAAKKRGLVRTKIFMLHTIISIFIDKRDFVEVMPFFNEYEKLVFEYDKPYEIAGIHRQFGEYYLSINQLEKSNFYLQKSFELQNKYKQIESNELYKDFSNWHKAKKDYKTSLSYLWIYLTSQDSLLTIEKEKTLKAIDDFHRIYNLDNSLASKNIELKNQTLVLNNEKQQKYFFIIGLIVAILLIVLAYKSLKYRKAANLELSNKNVLIESQNTMLQHKTKEILDSINYAKKIQLAMLPGENDFNAICPEAFILFNPRDIVSGDFYWYSQNLVKNNVLMFATADCTGHGVPGGFMSMLGASLLNEIVDEKSIDSPALVLNLLRDKIIAALTHDDQRSNDGMDMVLFRIDFNTLKLKYAGANNSFYIMRNGTLLENKPDKMPIGNTGGEAKPFNEIEVQLEKSDIIYSFTDGYPDQFGGPKGKKMKYKGFEKILSEIHLNSLESQKIALLNHFDEWKGMNEQVDDVLIVGIKI